MTTNNIIKIKKKTIKKTIAVFAIIAFIMIITKDNSIQQETITNKNIAKCEEGLYKPNNIMKQKATNIDEISISLSQNKRYCYVTAYFKEPKMVLGTEIEQIRLLTCDINKMNYINRQYQFSYDMQVEKGCEVI